MSAAVISPVVPSLLPRGNDRVVGAGVASVPRRPLPLPSLIARTTAIVYGLSALDDRGRLADRSIMRALGWSAGCVWISTKPEDYSSSAHRTLASFQVTGQSHLRIPSPYGIDAD